jgi:alkanesulfonate monooxygenase SsuD/methylene tetrahydromethanopterin reductase-like flavin-dependent oxidoreductase (luciferase family)
MLKMRFGITPREWGDFFQEAYEQIKVAEKTGFESVWFEEHHENPYYLSCPIDALNAVAMHTSLKLGTSIAILPLYHPLRLAEQIAQLDAITYGRTILGVAAGYREKDFENFGVKLSERGEIMDEGLELIGRLLSEENVTFTGKKFKLRNATVLPRPYQKPRPPIWVGGWKQAAIKRAAKYGDAWFPGPVGTLKEVLEAKQVYEEELKKLGKKVEIFPIMRDVYVSESDDKAFEESKESFIYMYGIDYSSSGHPLVGGMKKDFEEWSRDRFIIGNPSTVIEQIDKLRKNGFNYVVLRVSLRKLTNEQIKNSIRLFGEKVIPYFNDG